MHNTLRDPLPVEMCKQVDQVEVLEQERSVGANPLGGSRVHDLVTVSILSILLQHLSQTDDQKTNRAAIGRGVHRGFVVAVGLWKERVDCQPSSSANQILLYVVFL